MEETLKDILPEGNVSLVLSEDGSGKGAALVAAVASKHKPDYTQWKLCGHNVNITEKDVDWYQLNYSWWAHCKLYEKLTLSLKALFLVLNRAIFVWPWNENSRTKQKQQTNGNGAIWLVYRTDTNARGFSLVKRTLGWKNFIPKNFLEINRYFALTSYCNTIGQSNNAFAILGFSLAGKGRGHVLTFLSIGW